MHKLHVLLASVATLLVASVSTLPATAVPSPAGQLASEVAASGTPHVLNGRVYSVTQVGNTMLLGGSFSSARNDSSQTALSRANLLAFDAQSGQISTAFLPNPNGTVQKIVDAGDGQTVYVAGNFTSIGGVARSRVARVRISDGTVVTAFNAGNITGQIRDMALVDGRLWIGGAFTHVGGGAQRALATLDPSTGARTSYMTRVLAGNHNDGNTQVLKFDLSSNGDRLVAVGNFDTLDGVTNHQLLMLDTSGASAVQADFITNFYVQPCSQSFDSYMRDIDFAPSGDFFVVSTTGAYGGSNGPCDTTARFETAATGTSVQPSWVNYTGGDTTYGVEVTDSAVYVGGHFRWQNNAFRGDAAGQGAVPREGIAALDPLNGLPFSWNPGRTKGVGVFDFLHTSAGLWVASDTDRIGAWQLKSRIARMRPDGVAFPAVVTPQLPNDVYSITGATISKRPMTTSTVGANESVPGGGINWSTVRGAFMLNGWLYLAKSDGNFVRRTFDGSSYGAEQAVNGAEQVVTFTDWRSDVAALTGMFYDSGRIYFTRSGSSQLHYRYFTAESGIVGAKRLTASGNVSGIDFAQVRGMFGTGSALYWATSDGNLRAMQWAHGDQAGAPVSGTAQVVSGPGADGRTWSSGSHFLFQDANGAGAGPNQAPNASFTVSCSDLNCTFDASGSSDPDGGIASYAWDFGDGTTGGGVNPQHAYAVAGAVTVTLTVTDSDGATAMTTRTAEPTEEQEPPDGAVVHVGTDATNRNSATHRVDVPSGVQPGDTLVLHLAVNTSSPTISTPTGWTLLEQVDQANVQGRLWTRTATAGDAGSEVRVALSGAAKGDLTVSAYRATDGATSVFDSEAAVATAGGTSHQAPDVTAPAGGWVLTHWSAKSSTATSWTAPAGATVRSATTGSGGGGVYGVTVDTGAPVSAGNVTGPIAVSDPSTTRVVMFSVAIGMG